MRRKTDEKSKYQYSGKVDAAFVHLSSGSEVSNYVNSSSITVNKSFGVAVYYVTGIQSRKATDNSYSVYCKGRILTA